MRRRVRPELRASRTCARAVTPRRSFRPRPREFRLDNLAPAAPAGESGPPPTDVHPTDVQPTALPHESPRACRWSHPCPRCPPRLPRCLSRLYYGVPRLRRLRSRRHCGPPPQGRPRLRVLAGCLCPMGARRLGRLQVLGPHHARFHLYGRPGDGLLLRTPSTRRPHHRADVSPRLRARPPPHRARRLPHHWYRERNAVDLHQRPRANRPRLPAPLPVLESRIPRAGPRCRRRPRPHLARLCPPRRQHRTRRRRHRRVVCPTRGAPRRRVAQKCQRLPRLRRLVPQPLPARVALRLQRRRLPNAQLHPEPGHHDLRPHGR